MKIRAGFVSNSSSSSFVVVGKEITQDMIDAWPKSVVVGETGETEFGWGPGRCTHHMDRLNFAVLQTQYIGSGDDWYEMIKSVLQEEGITIERDLIRENSSDVYAYIDHQSSAIEGENTEIFDDKYALRHFLFSDESFIQLDNDNH